MGVWTDHVVPRITDAALRRPEIGAFRDEVAAGLAGEIVEIGFGSGLNVPHYPEAVRVVHAIEPSEVARRMAGARVAATTAEIRFSGLDGQSLPLADASVDAALSTFTLCTIPDVRRALREVHRVLRPGGGFHFAEHGLSPERDIATWQRRLNPMQKRMFGGCHLDRAIDDLVRDAGFDVETLRTEYMPGPAVAKPWGYGYLGVARKPVAA